MRSLPGKIVKIGRQFVRVKTFSISPRAILTIYTRERRARMAQFFLKIDFLVQHMGISPQVKMASRYGLHPWLWLLTLHTNKEEVLSGFKTTARDVLSTIW